MAGSFFGTIMNHIISLNMLFFPPRVHEAGLKFP